MLNLELTDDEILLVRSLVTRFGVTFPQSKLPEEYVNIAIRILRKIEIATHIPAAGGERDWLSLVDPNNGFLSEEDQEKVNAASAVASGLFRVSKDTRKLAAQAVIEGLVEPIAQLN
ncbi:MAG: hypothetical protein WAN17_20050 [Candidatus Sulfotelmatobacter sp.]